MKRLFLFLAAAALLFAGCEPKVVPAPVVPEKSRLQLQRADFFGTEVAADPAVNWRPNGLGIKIVSPGEGAAPQLSDRILLRYTGRLKDGTVFSQTAPDKPLEAKLGEMIAGMTSGIAELKPSGRAILYIPPSLGYGSQRAGKIPPVSGLIFDVELIAVAVPL